MFEVASCSPAPAVIVAVSTNLQLPGVGPQVRHPHVRARDVLPAARVLDPPVRLLPLLQHPLQQLGQHAQRHHHAPHERCHPEEERRLRQRPRRQVGHAGPQAVPHEQVRGGRAACRREKLRAQEGWTTIFGGAHTHTHSRASAGTARRWWTGSFTTSSIPSSAAC